MMVRRSKFWRAYFFLLAFLMIAIYAVPYVPWFFPPLEFAPDGKDFGHFALTIVELFGLYGFAYSRRLGGRAVWRVVFAVSVLLAAYSAYMLLAETDAETRDMFSSPMFLAIGFVSFGLFIPLWIALFRYAWTDRQLWMNRDSAGTLQ